MTSKSHIAEFGGNCKIVESFTSAPFLHPSNPDSVISLNCNPNRLIFSMFFLHATIDGTMPIC
jgi:hypothetical protein